MTSTASTGAVVGVDPGVSGAVVRLEAGRLTVRRDFKRVEDIAAAVVALSPGASAIVIEQVHAMPGEGVCSVWSFAYATGTAVGAALTVPGVPLVRVTPQAWQKFYRETLELPKAKFKAMTQPVAASLFPGQQELFARKKDHNTADASLLALWGLMRGSAQGSDWADFFMTQARD
jgi:crossover junction endodeoxyribonuclease RuvC